MFLTQSYAVRVPLVMLLFYDCCAVSSLIVRKTRLLLFAPMAQKPAFDGKASQI